MTQVTGIPISALTAAVALLIGCTSPEAETPDMPPPARSEAEQIIDESIEVHGGDRYEEAVITFEFRGEQFVARHAGGRYTYERIYEDSTGQVHDVLLNGVDLDRTVGGQPVGLAERDSMSASSSVNSVLYFAVLPFRLNDPAVRKRYLGEATVQGEPYHKIEVTFGQQDGGRDWQDRFVYWIHQDQKTMDYLAYRFGDASDDTRFREAVNVRTVNGIRFADYHNLFLDSLGLDIAMYDRLFEEDRLEKLSDVNLENVEVTTP